MKKHLILLFFISFLTEVYSQTEMIGERKFQILVKNENSIDSILKNSNELKKIQRLQAIVPTDSTRGKFLNLLKKEYGSVFVQRSATASTQLLNIGLRSLIAAIKGNRERWYQTAREQCKFVQPLISKEVIDDFYALPSQKGALDPENLKFEGFVCRNYIELKDKPNHGRDVFYVFCRLRKDSVGLNHIVNHSKFMVELDTLMFSPKYCNLPNDSTGSIESRFDFDKRKNLVFTLKVRIYSSWINEAIMITQDQLLGEFTIQVNIDRNRLNKDGIYFYNKKNPQEKELVSVSGDCFIVPRSFTGSTDFKKYQSTWGTGQYRIEMDVIETCEMVDEYYQKTKQKSESLKDSSPMVTKGKCKRIIWDKNKWKPEWNIMKSRLKDDSQFENAWEKVKVVYRGDSWETTLTSPLVTALNKFEAQKLNDWLDLNP